MSTAIKPITFGDVLLSTAYRQTPLTDGIYINTTTNSTTIYINTEEEQISFNTSNEPNALDVSIRHNGHSYSSSKPIANTTKLPETLSKLMRLMDLISQSTYPVISTHDEKKFNVGLELLGKWIAVTKSIETAASYS